MKNVPAWDDPDYVVALVEEPPLTDEEINWLQRQAEKPSRIDQVFGMIIKVFKKIQKVGG